MSAPAYTVVTMAERPDLIGPADGLVPTVWAEFMLHDAVANRYWDDLYTVFPAYQFVLLDPTTGEIAAVANSLPLAWDGDPADLPDAGWDWALAQGFEDHHAGRAPRTQCALSISIMRPYQGTGVSTQVVQAMKAIGQAHGLRSLIAPVRPNLKSRYPLIPIEDYIRWQNDAGLPFDAWLRVHRRLGAALIKVCPLSMVITGTVSAWEEWTGMQFPASGQHIIPGALLPVTIERDTDRGVYVEPNVWMHHPLA
ncbi:MAG: GNAT family N-acetyltransferase [Chloroflexi bacterium]|nr:GNAT family N-acetyltransferase [Chloroflexota bacterium]